MQNEQVAEMALNGENDHHVDDDQDATCNPKSESHVVQCPGCPAVPLCCNPVAHVVCFTSLKVSKTSKTETGMVISMLRYCLHCLKAG